VLDEPVILIPRQMAKVRRVASDQIIDGDYAMTFRQLTVGQMRSQKTGATSHHGNGLGFLRRHGSFIYSVVRPISSKKQSLCQSGIFQLTIVDPPDAIICSG